MGRIKCGAWCGNLLCARDGLTFCLAVLDGPEDESGGWAAIQVRIGEPCRFPNRVRIRAARQLSFLGGPLKT